MSVILFHVSPHVSAFHSTKSLSFIFLLSGHLSSLLHRISVLHNFTIESQVRYHAPLAFEPHHVGLDNEGIYGLTQDDLKVFVNSAEWTLCQWFPCFIFDLGFILSCSASSASNDPVLHFILFIPSVSHTPLRILDANSELHQIQIELISCYCP